MQSETFTILKLLNRKYQTETESETENAGFKTHNTHYFCWGRGNPHLEVGGVGGEAHTSTMQRETSSILGEDQALLFNLI